MIPFGCQINVINNLFEVCPRIPLKTDLRLVRKSTCSSPTALGKVLQNIVLIIQNIIFLLPLTRMTNVVIISAFPLTQLHDALSFKIKRSGQRKTYTFYF
jgi:hypothetical protein